MIEFITKDEFETLSAGHSAYYAGRWDYMGPAIAVAKSLGVKYRTSIELGSYLFSIMKGGDTMDILPTANPTYVVDANKTSWPIPDKHYDLFIGLEVLEHLEDKAAAFREIRRIADYALICLPYRWHCPGDCHHNINKATVYRWTKTYPVYQSPSDPKLRYLILLYNFTKEKTK